MTPTEQNSIVFAATATATTLKDELEKAQQEISKFK